MRNVLLSLAVWVAGSLSVSAAPGDLDPSFGGANGIIFPHIGIFQSFASAVAVQGNGKIVTVGTYLDLDYNKIIVTRLNPDGSLDASFDGDGVKLFGDAVTGAEAKDVALQADGKIVVLGWGGEGALVARFNSDGTFDSSFNGTGKASFRAPGNGGAFVEKFALQSDGKIVIAGYCWNGIKDVYLVARMLTNGVLDTTFATNGLVTTSFYSGPWSGTSCNDRALAIAIQPDGKIIAAGYSAPWPQKSDLSLARYNGDGTLDATFSGDGKLVEEFAPDAALYSVALQNDGKIVVAGIIDGHCFFRRYTGAGANDFTFSGFVSVEEAWGLYSMPAQVAVQEDGKIVVAGMTGDDEHSDALLFRLNRNGGLDVTFGKEGAAASRVAYKHLANLSGVAIQADGRIVVAGHAQPTYNWDTKEFGLARYEGNVAPLVTLVGAHPLPHEIGTPYTDPGAIATDHEDGTLTPTMVSNSVNPNVLGTYAVRWEASDSKGLVTGATRTVEVVDTTPPVFTQVPLGGCRTSYAVPNLVAETRATDNSGVAPVITQNPPAGGVFSPPGPFTVTLTAADPCSNSVQVTVNFTVQALSSGALDPAFGHNGSTNTSIGVYDDRAAGVALQSDGKLVVAGYSYTGSFTDFSVARYLTNGVLDTTFNGTGSRTVAISGSTDEAADVALQTDGKIVLAGYARIGATDDFALARLHPDGTLDTSFNGTGKVTTPVGTSHDRASAVAIQGDGKIVVAGCARISAIYRVALARYNTNGTLDTSFDGDGLLTTAIGTVDDRAYGLAIQADGKIVVAGASDNGTGTAFAFVRYLSDGSLDSSFDGDGKATVAVGGAQDGATCLRLQEDGKLVAGGYSGTYGNYDFAVVRLGTNGVPDTSFNGTGKVVTDFGGSDDYCATLLLQGSYAVAAGYSASGGYQNFALARYRGDGALDPAFDGDGKVVTSLVSGSDGITDAVLLAGGKIFAVGYAQPGSYYEYALALYEANTPPGLTLLGPTPLEIEAAASYVDPGATPNDLEDGALAPFITTNTVVCNTTGLYSVVWTVYDTGGLASTLTRSVRVVDTTAPSFISVPTGRSVPMGSQVTNLTALVLVADNSAGPVTVTQHPADGSLFEPMGPFPVTITATDPSGNSSDTVVLYTVTEPNRPPVVTLVGDNPLTVEARSTYTDPGATAADIEDGQLMPVMASNSVLPRAVGAYAVTWRAIDSGGLTGRVTRSVQVRDTTSPVFTTVPAGTTVPVGTRVPDLTTLAVATDNSTSAVSFSQDPSAGSVFGAIGTAQVTLSARDDSGNMTNAVVTYNVRVVKPGDLDYSFGDSGSVVLACTNADWRVHAAALQFDGKIVVVGERNLSGVSDFAVARFNADGTPDLDFGNSGVLTTSFGGAYNCANGVAIQADGRIVVVGLAGVEVLDSVFAVARYLVDGTLDTSFNGTGRQTIDMSRESDSATCVGLQPDGKIVIAGNTGFVLLASSAAVARLLPDGTLDTSFDGDGKVETSFGSDHSCLNALVIRGGKILVAGTAFVTGGPRAHNTFALARYNGDGTLDSTFDTDGWLTVRFGDGWLSEAFCIALQSDGKIVVGGSYVGNCFAFARLTSGGALDTFGEFGTGKMTFDAGDGENAARGLAIQNDGRIVAAGYADFKFAAVRLKSGGKLDNTFDGDGKVTVSVGGVDDKGQALLLQRDGKIIVAGTASIAGHDRFALVRFANPLLAEIVVQQPSGAELPDGGYFDFGPIALGDSLSRNFVVKNAGTLNLTGLQITCDGPNAADFEVTQSPVSPVVPDSNTTFIVRCIPSGAGARGAALHIVNNDPEDNPFDIRLAATGLSFVNDSDHDGLNDGAEWKMASLGFDWQVSQPGLIAALLENANGAGLYTQPQMEVSRIAGRADVTNAPNAYNLYTPAQVQDLNIGMSLLSRDPTTGECLLTIGVQKSTDLISFDPLPATIPQLGVSGQGQIEFRFPSTNNAAFFRLQSR